MIGDGEELHPLFQKALRESMKTVQLMGRYFVLGGWGVEIPPLRISPTHAQHKEYSDHGDLWIYPPFNPNVRLLIEIKGLSAEFTCRGDWPFGDEVIVDQKSSFDQKKVKPYAYYYLNQARTHTAKLRVKSSRDRWYESEKVNTAMQGRLTIYYCLPTDCVDFFPLWGNENAVVDRDLSRYDPLDYLEHL